MNGVWDVANYLMAVALVAALQFNARRTFEDREGERDDGASLRSLTANLCLYLTAGVALLFFRNWFLEMAGANGDNSITGLIWVVVNVCFHSPQGRPVCRCGGNRLGGFRLNLGDDTIPSDRAMFYPFGRGFADTAGGDWSLRLMWRRHNLATGDCRRRLLQR